MTELIAGIFTVAVLGTTIWLCRGLRLTSRDICLAGLMSAATLVLRCFLITLPNGSHISLGAMLPILLLSLIHRPQVAFCAGWVTGVLAMLLLPEWQPVHWAQPFVEQLICFSALGYAGIFGAEPASENMRQEIRDKLGIRYCDVYGLSEVMGPGVAMECSESHGLHLAEDHFFAEIIDPETLQPVPDGTYGELVFTTLTRECCPLVRYRTRDITRIINEECSCGRTHRKIDRIIGRSDDMMIIRGVNVFPQQIEQIITGFDEITAHYQIVLTDNGPLDKVTLNVETVPEFPIDEIRKLEDLKTRLGAELKSNLQIKVDIKIVEPKSIERSEGKAKRVIDLREGKH